MILSLLPVQVFGAEQTQERGRVLTPRRIGREVPMVQFGADWFAATTNPVATTGSSLSVGRQTHQRWVRNVELNPDTGRIEDYVLAEFDFEIFHDLGVANSLELSPSVANLQILSSTPPSLGFLGWQGHLMTREDGTGTISLALGFNPASVPTGEAALDLRITFSAQNYQGTATPTFDRFLSVNVNFSPPSPIPALTIPNNVGTMYVGRSNTLGFDVNAAGTPLGNRDIYWHVERLQNGNYVPVNPDAAPFTLPETLQLGAGGAGTLTVRGTPTAADIGVWYLTVMMELPVIGNRHWEDEWIVEHVIRVDIRRPVDQPYTPSPPSEPTPPTPTPTPTPPQPPQQQPPGTTVVIVNNVTKVVVSKNVTTTKIVNIINTAREKGERPVVEIELEDDQDGVQIGGGDVKNLIVNNGVLVIVNNNVSIQFNANQMANWNINVESEIIISVRPVEDPQEKERKFRGKRNRRKPGNATTVPEMISMFLSVVVEVNITIDGINLTDADSRPTLSIDISDKNLSEEELANLVGVFFFLEDPDDPYSIAYIIVNGILDGNMFEVPIAIEHGWFTLMSIAVEVEVSVQVAVEIPSLVRLQLGSTAVAVDGAPQAGMDVAPFFAEPGNPDSLMLPLRALAEALGAEVHWNAALSMVIVVNVQLNINFSFNVNQPLPTPPSVGDDDDEDYDEDMGEAEIVGDRTFVPRRFMQRMMGVTVDYDPTTGGIYVTNDAAIEAAADDNDEDDDNDAQ
jgi:hypothetical protein